jgi:peptide/nickel transport system substrate-binding protein
MKKKPVLLLIALIIAACSGTTGTGTPAVAISAETPRASVPMATEVTAISLAEAERRATVYFDIDGGPVLEPENWNLYLPERRLNHGFHQALVEPLFILNYETGQIESWLGLSMTANEAFDSWTLKLRPGVKWSDGEDFNADDVTFTVNMLLDHAPDLAYSADMKRWVDSVEKIDDLTVRFNLKQPNPRFQLDFWSVKIWKGPSIVPEHIWRDKDPLTFKNYDPGKGWPVFTGPYTLESVSETKFVYVRDDDWWGAQTGWRGLPRPERLVWVWYGSEEERVAAMANNQLDSLLDVSLGSLLELQRRNLKVISHFKDLPYAWVPDPCARNLELNLTVAPWDDKAMRWALNYAISRDEIVAFAYDGTTIASRHFFPAYPPLNRYLDLLEEAELYSRYPLMEYNPDTARQTIESKGYALNASGYYEKDGRELSLDITTHAAFVEKQRIAEVIVEQLRRAGINASTRNEDEVTWYRNFALGQFEARIGWQACASVNEPWASMDTFNARWLKPVGERTAENQNAWRWSGEAAGRYGALVDQIGSLPLGDPRIDGLLVEAMSIWLDELPIIPIAQARKIIPFNTTYWTGWPTAEDNYIQPPTWWQSTHIIIHNLEPAQP